MEKLTPTPEKIPSWATVNSSGLHGNTAPGRIRLLDNALSLLQVPPFLPQSSLGQFSSSRKPFPWQRRQPHSVNPIVVDIGVGDDPSTTIELAAALRPEACVVGTEVDADRLRHSEVVMAELSADVVGKISLRLGTTDFGLSDGSLGRPLLVRAMNVLRDYTVPDAIAALRKLYSQVIPGGVLVEGGAETEGRVAVVMLLHRNLESEEDEEADEKDDDEEEEEEELSIAAVIFAADLAALALDPEYDRMVPAKWFNRHNHLPRLYRGFCDASECSRDAAPAWVVPMRSFLRKWEDTNVGLGTIEERFVSSAMDLEASEETGTVVIDWLDRGIVVWMPGEKGLVVPNLEEWSYYRQRLTYTR